MKILLLFLCVAISQAASAASVKRKPDSREGQTPHLLQMDEDFPIESAQSDGVMIHPLSEVGKNSEALPVNLQEQFFRESGLGPIVGDWDGFEKDRLALRTENQDPREVFARYEGRLPEAGIRKLKILIRAYRKDRQ